jgi:hypothetical protein
MDQAMMADQAMGISMILALTPEEIVVMDGTAEMVDGTPEMEEIGVIQETAVIGETVVTGDRFDRSKVVRDRRRVGHLPGRTRRVDKNSGTT